MCVYVCVGGGGERGCMGGRVRESGLYVMSYLIRSYTAEMFDVYALSLTGRVSYKDAGH